MNQKIARLWKFLTDDIWRITESEVTKSTYALYNIIKTVYICITRFANDRLINKASALTYSTLLAIVPILAVLFAIARGFGFDNVMEEQIKSNFGGSPEAAEAILSFTQSYLAQTKSGVFLGFGLVLLFWTVINLVMEIEITFNRIWEVKRQRSVYRQITDFFSMILLAPILIVVSAGLSIFTTTTLKEMEDFALLAPIFQVLIRLIPYIFTWFMFTGLYVFMPNTKVRFKHALVAGIIAGTAFQAFQYLYINSQLELGHKTLHIIEGSPGLLRIHNLINEIADTIYIRQVKDYGPEQLLAMVSAGDIDYAVCDENIASASLAAFPNLDISKDIGFTQFYAWGVNKHSPVLLDTLNNWLERYKKTDKYKKLYKKYFN